MPGGEPSWWLEHQVLWGACKGESQAAWQEKRETKSPTPQGRMQREELGDAAREPRPMGPCERGNQAMWLETQVLWPEHQVL